MATSNKQLTSFFIEDILSLKDDKKDDSWRSENNTDDSADRRTGTVGYFEDNFSLPEKNS